MLLLAVIASTSITPPRVLDIIKRDVPPHHGRPAGSAHFGSRREKMLPVSNDRTPPIVPGSPMLILKFGGQHFSFVAAKGFSKKRDPARRSEAGCRFKRAALCAAISEATEGAVRSRPARGDTQSIIVGAGKSAPK